MMSRISQANLDAQMQGVQPAPSPSASATSGLPFSYQLDIPTSDFGSLQNQLKQAINRGDEVAQKAIRSQMLEALNGGR